MSESISPDNRPILIIDGANVFYRAFAAFPAMSSNGVQAGGVVGFLKTLRSVVDQFQPKQVFITWESGGSARRRAIFPAYKENRKPQKLNRFYEDDIPETEENRVEQNLILVQLLRELPICQVYVEDAEGDDVVGFLCRNHFLHDNKILMSSDRDFYQLLDDRTSIYTPDRKWVRPVNVLERFGVSSQNFAVAKAICGDAGDNIPGVNGIQFKRLTSKFPMLADSKEHLLDEIIDFGRKHYKASPIISKIIDDEALVRRNFRLVILDSSMLSGLQVERIQFAIDTFEPKLNKLRFTQKLIDFGINTNFNVDDFFFAFRSFMMIVAKIKHED